GGRLPALDARDVALQGVRAASQAARVPHPCDRERAPGASRLQLSDHDAAAAAEVVQAPLRQEPDRHRGARGGTEGLGRGRARIPLTTASPSRSGQDKSCPNGGPKTRSPPQALRPSLGGASRLDARELLAD